MPLWFHLGAALKRPSGAKRLGSLAFVVWQIALWDGFISRLLRPQIPCCILQSSCNHSSFAPPNAVLHPKWSAFPVPRHRGASHASLKQRWHGAVGSAETCACRFSRSTQIVATCQVDGCTSQRVHLRRNLRSVDLCDEKGGLLSNWSNWI